MVVETEPRFDASDRALLMGLRLFKAGVCRCGYHSTLTHDKANKFAIETDVCPVCAAADMWERVQQDKDGDFADTPARKPRPSDGRHVGVRHTNPGET